MYLNLVSFNPNSAKHQRHKDWVIFFFFFFSALALDPSPELSPWCGFL